MPGSELGIVDPDQFIAWLAKYMTVSMRPFLIARRARYRRAHVERIERRQLLEVAVEHVADAQHERVSLVRREPAPRTLERAPRRSHRRIDVFLAAARKRREHAPVGGVEGLDALATQRRAPLPVDEMLLA